MFLNYAVHKKGMNGWPTQNITTKHNASGRGCHMCRDMKICGEMLTVEVYRGKTLQG